MTLYAVTSAECNQKHNRTTEEAVAAAVAGGATIMQVGVIGQPAIMTSSSSLLLWSYLATCADLLVTGTRPVVQNRASLALAWC